MSTSYAPAPQVKDIADELIRDVEHHKLLAMVRVEYVWRDKAPESKGRLVLGKARKIGGLNAFLARNGAGWIQEDAAGLVEPDPFFVVEIAADTWERLSPQQRVALVDHELCHLAVFEGQDEGEFVLNTRGHDLEEFGCIVSRHGLWKSDVAAFGSVVAEQLTLAIDECVRFVDGMRVDPETGEITEK